MDQLKHYTELSRDLADSNPAVLETLEEEINILIHKLKFIPWESRPTVLIQQLSGSSISPDYLEEICQVAGGRLIEYIQDPAEADFLIFIQDSPEFISQLPGLLEAQYSGFKAMENNQVYLVQKPDYAVQKSDYLQDIEILAEIVQGKYFVYGHEGNYWMKFGL